MGHSSCNNVFQSNYGSPVAGVPISLNGKFDGHASSTSKRTSIKDFNKSKTTDGKYMSFLGEVDNQEKEESSLFSSPSPPASISSNNPKSSIESSVSEVQCKLNFPYDLEGYSTYTKSNTLHSVTVHDLCNNSEMSSVKGSQTARIILHAVHFYVNNAQWDFFYCYLCNKKFLDAESHAEHMLYQHLHFCSSDCVMLLPVSVKKSMIAWHQNWKEPSLAWFMFMYGNDCNPVCFTKSIETRKCSDKKIGLLKRIGQSFDSLLSHDDHLSTGHLTRLIERTTDCFLDGLRDEKSAAARDLLDQFVQLPIGMLDQKCLKLVHKRLRWLDNVFTRQSATIQKCHESEVRTQTDDFLSSISLHDNYGVICFDPTKLSPEAEPSVDLEVPWTNTKMQERFSKVFECMKSLVHLLNTKFAKKYELLRNWDLVILLERMLFNENSRNSIRSSLEEWRDKLTQRSDDLSRSFCINFVSDVLRIAEKSQKSIEVIFKELKYRRVLDELDTLDVEMSSIVARIKKSKQELSLICQFDHRTSLLPFLKEFIRSKTETTSLHTPMRKTQLLQMPYYPSSECPPTTRHTTSLLRTPLMDREVDLKKQSLAFWSSLSEEQRKELLSVTPYSIYDYCCFHLKSPWLALEVHKAIRFFTLNGTWRFFSCIDCSRSFHEEMQFSKHHTVTCRQFLISNPEWEWWGWRFQPEPIGKTRLAKVLLEMDWTPIDVPVELKFFAEMYLLHECKDYAFLPWPTVKDDKRRTKRLNVLKSYIHTLLRQKPSVLSYTHLQTMIELASDAAFSQLTSKRDQFFFTKILKSSPVCFRFLDSKSLGKLVTHVKIIRVLTNRYTNHNYISHSDSESEDYDSERDIDPLDDCVFDKINTESDIFWRNRENLNSISINHDSFHLDINEVCHGKKDDSPVSWILDAPLVPAIFEYPCKIPCIFGLVEEQWNDTEEGQWDVYKFRALHFYVCHLQEYTCFKRWMQLFGSKLRGKYDLFIMRRYEELLGNARRVIRVFLPQLRKQSRIKSELRCNNCNGSSFCHTCCVASLEMKRNYSISKQTRYYINAWQSIYRLMTLEPLASKAVDLDYRVILLPLIRSLIRMKLEVRLSGGGEEEFYKACRNEQVNG